VAIAVADTKPIHLTAPPPRAGSTALYRFFSADGVLLYIGITVRPPVRWYTHSTTQHWWPKVSAAFVQWLPNGQAEDAEREAIRTERPKYNQQSAEDIRAAQRALRSLRPETEPEVDTAAAARREEMLTFTRGAALLVELGLVPTMTREGIRKIAATEADWPFGPKPKHPYGKLANAQTMDAVP